MKLKTLKDLEGMSYADLWFVNEWQLRQEAIKRVKKCEKDREVLIRSANNFVECDNLFRGEIRALTEFFNITEEDLK